MWEVYAYWNVELLESVFNGLAAISGSNAYETLMYAVALLGFIVVMAVAVARIRAEEPVIWIFFLTFFYGVLFIPKDSVVIIDRTAASGAAPRIVNNVPIGAAAFVSMTSKIGDWLTRTYETAFSIPSTLRYTGNGMTFGARIIQAATNAHFIDVKLNQDLMEYIRSCVAPDLVSGHKDLETLMKSEDIWAEMGDTNPARAVWLTATGIGVTDCLTGYEQLTPKVTAATQQAHSWVSRMLNARVAVTDPHANLNALFATQLPGAAEVLLKVTTANSMDFVKQAALANLWRIAPGSLAAAVENTSAAQLAIAEANAQESSRVAYKSMANISAEALPKFRNAFQVVIISVFPIIMLMILFMGHKGGIVLKHYVLALLWIETWPVIFAVSSYLAQVDSAGPTMSLIGGLANPPVGQGISMLNIGAVQDWMLRTEHVAGVLTTWIPGFAAALLWGGAFAMTSIAGSVMAPAQSAAQRAGSEVGMGNVNMGNLRYDTFAARTTEANSWNTRGRYAPGAMPGQTGGTDYTDQRMGTYTGAAGKVFTSGGAPIAMQPTGGSAQVGASSGKERTSGVTQTGQTSLAIGEVSTLVDQIAARSSQGSSARVGESLAQAIAQRVSRGSGAESGTGGRQTTGAGLTAKGDAGIRSDNTQRDQLLYGAGLPGSLSGPGPKGAPPSAAPEAAAGAPGALANIAGKAKGFAGVLMRSLRGQWTHSDEDSMRQHLQALTSSDANKARQAYREVGEAKRYLDEIAASPREERGVREAARDISRALDKTLSAARQQNRALTDTESVTDSKSESSRAGVTAAVASNLAAHQVLAQALGHDPNSPQGLLAAAEFANRHPQAAQSIMDSYRDKSADGGVLNAAGPGPGMTREGLRDEGKKAVQDHNAAGVRQVGERDAQNIAAYGPLARAMTGMDPNPDGKVGADALASKLKKEMAGVRNMNMAEQRQAYTEYGAARVAVELHRQELKAKGEDFGDLDPRRPGQIQSRLLAEAERQEKAGNPQLRVWLENEGKSDRDLPGVRLRQIQTLAGIRMDSDNNLTWDMGRPEIKPPPPTAPTYKPAPGQKG